MWQSSAYLFHVLPSQILVILLQSYPDPEGMISGTSYWCCQGGLDLLYHIPPCPGTQTLQQFKFIYFSLQVNYVVRLD